jgi:hypothetical protein
VLLGDGTTVTFDGSLNTFLLCLQLQNLESDNRFTVYDFAMANSTFTSFTPLGISTSLQVTVINGAPLCLSLHEAITICLTTHSIYPYLTFNKDEYLCGELTSIVSQTTFFPIKRIDNWVNEPHRLYNQETLGLMYTLAVLFLIVAIAATINLGILIYSTVKYDSIVTLKHWLVFFIWIFNLGTFHS